MGQKVNPIGLRLGINRNWESRWFPSKATLSESIGEDYKIRKFLKAKLYYAGISQILIERTAKPQDRVLSSGKKAARLKI